MTVMKRRAGDGGRGQFCRSVLTVVLLGSEEEASERQPIKEKNNERENTTWPFTRLGIVSGGHMGGDVVAVGAGCIRSG